MTTRPFRSPLLGTALVVAALAVVAVPLHRLTAHGGKATVTPAGKIETDTATTPAILRIRAIDALRDVEIRTTGDHVLYRADIMEPGEIEADVHILLEEEAVEFHLVARAGDKETAVFVTLLPDGREERTSYAIGSGALVETLCFTWEHHHE